MSKYKIDMETYSEADLAEVGAYRYAFDPSFEILCMAIRREDEKPVIWRCDGRYPSVSEYNMVMELLDELSHPSSIIYAWNASFEFACAQAAWSKTFNTPTPRAEQFRCTQVMARRAGLRPSLERCGEYLGLEIQKDKRGKALIKFFCMLQPAVPGKPGKPAIPDRPKGPPGSGIRAKKGKPAVAAIPALPVRRMLPQDHKETFDVFCDYCVQDVLAECSINAVLAAFELDNQPLLLAAFHMDLRINARGLPVNLDALHKANIIVKEQELRQGEAFMQLTGLRPSQGVKFKAWLQERGYKGANLQAKTIEDIFEGVGDDEEIEEALEGMLEVETGMTEEAVAALRIKQKLSFASVKKIPKMIQCAGPHDNRVRGCHIFGGARTMRWAATLVQPQNFKKPTIKNTEEVYADLIDGMDSLTMEVVHGPPLDAIGSSIRHFIHDTTFCTACGGCGTDDCINACEACGGNGRGLTRPFLDADFSSVEARIVCWLAEQEDALVRFRNKEDSYIQMAALIYDRPESEIKAGYVAEEPVATYQRWVGKQTVLGCGFQMGVDKYVAQCKKYGVIVSEELAEKAIAAYRKLYKKVKALWWDLGVAFKNAINHPGSHFYAGKLSCFSLILHGRKFAFIKLPSGRSISYPDPRIAEDGRTIQYYSQAPKSKHFWCHIDTHGAKLVENATQAVAADFMMNGAVNAERDGFQIAALIHDEALAYKLEPSQTWQRLCENMTRLPAWAEGMPLAAEGKEIPFYKK